MEDKIIVSLTTYYKRFETLPIVLESLLCQTVKPFKIVVVLDKDDVSRITSEMQKYFDLDIFDVIITDDNIRPHKKYFYTMLKYRKNPIITVDDDCEYNHDMIESLYRTYKEHPDCVCGLETAKVGFHVNGTPKLKTSWKFHTFEYDEPSFQLVAEGIGGILYPPNILKMKKSQLSEIYQFTNEDDLYLKMVEVRNGIKVITAKAIEGKQRGKQLECGKEYGLYKLNNATGSAEYINKIPKEIWEKIRNN